MKSKFLNSIFLLPTLVIGFVLMNSISADVMASPDGYGDQRQATPEQMHERIKAKLDELSERLEIKSSQQAVWGEYAKSIEMLAEHRPSRPDSDADAAAISRYRAERATEFASRLGKIADATAKLEAALTEDQKKTFDQMARRSFHRGHEWKKHQERDREDHNGEHDRDESSR